MKKILMMILLTILISSCNNHAVNPKIVKSVIKNKCSSFGLTLDGITFGRFVMCTEREFDERVNSNNNTDK
jgi:hypothetical protein